MPSPHLYLVCRLLLEKKKKQINLDVHLHVFITPVQNYVAHHVHARSLHLEKLASPNLQILFETNTTMIVYIDKITVTMILQQTRSCWKKSRPQSARVN